MASIRKRGGKWQVQIRRRGARPVAKTFTRKVDALTWARWVETEIERGIFIDPSRAEETTLGDLLARYAHQVVPTLKGQRPELSRVATLTSHLGHLAVVALTPAVLAEYRDMRLKTRAAQSVVHEIGVLRRVLKRASLDWGIPLPRGLPKVRYPRLPRGRDRRLEPGEEARLIDALKCTPVIQALVVVAIETAMRRGELVASRWEHVNLERRLLTVPDSKTGVGRVVPLSRRAAGTLEALPRRVDGLVFGVQADSVTQAFHRACRRAHLTDLRFHDLRHEAVSRLFERGLSIMEVSAISGHRDLSMLKRYTHLNPERLVARLG